MIYLGYEHKTLLFGNSGREFVGYPTEVGRVYVQYLVQKMSAVLTEEYQIISVALHSFSLYSTNTMQRGE